MKLQTSTTAQRKRGAVYQSLIRVGTDTATIKQISERSGLTPAQVAKRVRTTRAKGLPVTWEIFG